MVVKPEIPPTLRHCRDVEVPGDMQSQKAVAVFLPSLAAGYLDCRNKLESVVHLTTDP